MSNERGQRSLLSEALAGVAALYVAGVLISNLYLLSFGAADFSLLRPRAIATGLLFVVPMA